MSTTESLIKVDLPKLQSLCTGPKHEAMTVEYPQFCHPKTLNPRTKLAQKYTNRSVQYLNKSMYDLYHKLKTESDEVESDEVEALTDKSAIIESL